MRCLSLLLVALTASGAFASSGEKCTKENFAGLEMFAGLERPVSLDEHEGNRRFQCDDALDVWVGFTSHINDSETGLVYAKARYLEPETGRFLSEDPFRGSVGDPFSTQGFTYAHANPTRFVDLDGFRAATPDEAAFIQRIDGVVGGLSRIQGDSFADTSLRSAAFRAKQGAQRFRQSFELTIDAADEGEAVRLSRSSDCSLANGRTAGLSLGRGEIATPVVLDECTAARTDSEATRGDAFDRLANSKGARALKLGLSIFIPEFALARVAGLGAATRSIGAGSRTQLADGGRKAVVQSLSRDALGRQLLSSGGDDLAAQVAAIRANAAASRGLQGDLGVVASSDDVILFHGTSSNRASKIVGNEFHEAQGFRSVAFFAEDFNTARHFARESSAVRRAGEAHPSSKHRDRIQDSTSGVRLPWFEERCHRRGCGSRVRGRYRGNWLRANLARCWTGPT